MNKYHLLDSGDGMKLEQFGPYLLARPCAQALWKKGLPPEEWKKAHASFSREGANKWTMRVKLPSSWIVDVGGLNFKIAPTDFGHLGVFPEHSMLWDTIASLSRKGANILNLFAYSGGATLAAARTGAKVCHLDASKGMVAWARENAALNQLEGAPIRWIVEDVLKFLKREAKRKVFYDGIILDPPSFGRGSKGEVFKIEKDLHELLELCHALLSKHPLFILFTSHTPGFTPLVMHHLLAEMMGKERISYGEMVIANPLRELPSGSYSLWK